MQLLSLNRFDVVVLVSSGSSKRHQHGGSSESNKNNNNNRSSVYLVATARAVAARAPARKVRELTEAENAHSLQRCSVGD